VPVYPLYYLEKHFFMAVITRLSYSFNSAASDGNPTKQCICPAKYLSQNFTPNLLSFAAYLMPSSRNGSNSALIIAAGGKSVKSSVRMGDA